MQNNLVVILFLCTRRIPTLQAASSYFSLFPVFTVCIVNILWLLTYHFAYYLLLLSAYFHRYCLLNNFAVKFLLLEIGFTLALRQNLVIDITAL